MNWRKPISRSRRYDELAESIREHLAEAIDARMAEGMSKEEATLAARREFGNVTFIEESSRDVWGRRRMESLWRDLRFGVRQLLRSPGFSLTVVLTLALAIGANTAIFSIVNALLLTKLPYPNPERLAVIYARRTDESYNGRRTMDGEQWELLRDSVPSLVSAASGMGLAGVNQQAGSQIRFVHAGRVSAHYLDVLGLPPLIGRNFNEQEDQPHGPRAVILSYPLWQTMFGGNPDVVGQSVLLKGEPYTVIGVLPENAHTPLDASLYTALQPSREGEGRAANFQAIVRLREGVGWQQANAELNRAWARSSRYQEVVGSGAQITYYLVPLQTSATSTLGPQALALLLSAGLILLIACANLAGLALVRMLRRTAEIATRQALGASHWQILRQLWVENLVLALAGGAAGIGVGFLALRGLLFMLPAHFLPVADVPLDARVLGFTMVLALATSILCGMLPAFAAGRADLRSSMGSRSGIGGGRVRLRQALIAGEVALTVVLLAAAGLVIRTLIHLETMPPGFNPTGVMTAKASLDDVRYHDPAAFRRLLQKSVARLREIPGVRNAAVGLTLPYERALLNGITIVDGSEAGQQFTVNEVYVTPGYFETLEIPLLAGRSFSEGDGLDVEHVAIINQTFARRYFHGANPVGRHLDRNIRIVGVVADTVISSAARLHEGTEPLTSQEVLYTPAAQFNESNGFPMVHVWYQPSWIVRTAGPVEGLTARMQRALSAADPNLPFSGFFSINDLMASTLATQRIEVALLSAMASLALLLSAVGIFALVANVVAQRTREIGIRMALGSTVRKAMVEVGSSGTAAAALGILLGLVLCAGALRAMRSVLYGVGVYDVPTILTAVAALSAVTLTATAVPALRVARVDPARTLREE